MVWFERQSPRSKFGRVHLDLFTTSNRLTPIGQNAIRALCATAKVSAYSAECGRVPLASAEGLAKAMFRSAVRNQERDTHSEWGRAASA